MVARRSSRQRAAGFTMIELIVVIILVGILGAIGASRFFDNTVFENRAYADQAKTIIRYAQKLAIAQNRFMYVRSDGNSFAVCSTPTCDTGTLIPAPSGSNSGSAATRNFCQQNTTWMCEGRPTNVVLSVKGGARPELGASGYFYFDALGRPYNKISATGVVSLLTPMTVIFTDGVNSTELTIEQETGYVH
jgi:MSHA pilin protein MshC